MRYHSCLQVSLQRYIAEEMWISVLIVCTLTFTLDLPGAEAAIPTGPGTVDNCDTSTRVAVSCDANGNETLCTEKGCHYCPNTGKADCVEGWACLLPVDDSVLCVNSPSEVITPEQCLARNCSWCASNPTGYKCILDPAEPLDTGAPPASPVNQCAQTTRKGCPAGNNITKCWELGCHYCQKVGARNCIEGIACKKTPTAADDCRDNATHSITARECLDRGCSYCKRNADIKCVKEFIPTGSGTVDNCDSSTRVAKTCNADGNETLCQEKGCHYCPSTVKPDCIEGWACLLTADASNVCTIYPSESLTPAECLARNCSWCADNAAGLECVKDPAEPIDNGAPPPSPIEQCDQDPSERVGCPAGNNVTKCWELGCHYCQRVGARNCIEGLACKETPTAANDCRDNSTHILTPRECLDRGCSYCKNNINAVPELNITCVRETEENVTVPSGNGDLDNCDTSTRIAVSCDANGNETLCQEKGCHYCPGTGKPDCIEGWACLLPANGDNVCTAYSSEVLTPAECLARNCSWCASNNDPYKCMKDPAEIVDTGAPPTSEIDNCAQDAAERVGCPAGNNITKCWELGCHYCQRVGAKNCIEGLGCKLTPTAANDCRDNSSHILTPRECLDRGCSYCEDNINAVPELNITCVRGACPAGTELRYDGGSCCNITGQPRLGQPRIVGGVSSEAGQWPWMVFILISDGNDTFGCGGFLVDNLHVISAAHCYLDNPTLQLRFGNVDINEATTIINLDGSDVVVHPDFDSVTFHNDIMIITLRSPITFDSNIASVSLPNGETSPDETTCFVAGWGATSSGGAASDILLETSINIQPISDCDPIFSIPLNDTIQICAGFAPGGQDSCQGDSGGPLMCQRCRNCDWFVAGIVSFGLGCALPQTPAVYARVSAYEEWLYENGVTDEGVEFDCN